MKWLLSSFLLLSGLTASAARLASFCSTVEGDLAQKIEGVHVDELLPIASVSKLITTHWALSTLNPEHRFTTKIYITPVTGLTNKIKLVDIHFEGSRDPFFGKESIHYLVSELNKKGIYNVRNVTFDDNFKFFWNVSGGPVVHNRKQKVEIGMYKPNDPSPKEVTAELRFYRNNWATGYDATRNYLKKFDVELLPKARLAVNKVEYLPASQYAPAPNTEIRTISSSPLMMLLREMNRNSNNHAANQIFESLGGAEKYKEFAAKMNLNEKDIVLVNGHGNRATTPEGWTYNKATCSAVVKIAASLSRLLQTMGKDLDDVLPVPAMDKNSTVAGYKDKSYSESVAAKTGTVGPAVTLAGLMKTRIGRVFFMYNIATKATEADWARARRQIAVRLVTLAKQSNGGMPFDDHDVKFVSFDPELFFQEEQDEGQTISSTAIPLQNKPPISEPAKAN
jgi:D-alanyl-D-alanine carboxypeptidase